MRKSGTMPRFDARQSQRLEERAVWLGRPIALLPPTRDVAVASRSGKVSRALSAFMLTPGWSWHGHGHDGDQPAYWFDGLDVPLNHLLEPMFFEEHPDGFVEVDVLTEESPYRFTWASTQKALETAVADAEGYFGPRILLDAPSIPTMALYVHRWESGFKTRKQRSASNNVYLVMQGSGTSSIGNETFHWQRGDTLAAPCWNWIEHQAKEDSVMFCMTDEPLMRFAKYYRFEGS